jgi:hypothetical protein
VSKGRSDVDFSPLFASRRPASDIGRPHNVACVSSESFPRTRSTSRVSFTSRTGSTRQVNLCKWLPALGPSPARPAGCSSLTRSWMPVLDVYLQPVLRSPLSRPLGMARCSVPLSGASALARKTRQWHCTAAPLGEGSRDATRIVLDECAPAAPAAGPRWDSRSPPLWRSPARSPPSPMSAAGQTDEQDRTGTDKTGQRQQRHWRDGPHAEELTDHSSKPSKQRAREPDEEEQYGYITVLPSELYYLTHGYAIFIRIPSAPALEIFA